MYRPIFRITPHLLRLIVEAGALRSCIEDATVKVHWLPALQVESRARAAHSSTSIEGNPLTLSQVEAISRGKSAGAGKADEKEVKNYLAAMRCVERSSRRKLDENMILRLHSILMKGLLPEEKCGRYKQKQNYVTDEKGIRVYTPPSPKDTPKLMKELVGWFNSGEAAELHSVIVCAVLHHRLVSIHPFSDGNGRLARALSIWVLYQKGYDTRHIFSIDEYFADNRKFYYDKIEQARELDDDLTCWIEYVAQGIVDVLKKTKKRVEGLRVSSGAGIILSPRQEEIIGLLRDNGPLNVSAIIRRMKVTRSRINQIIQPLMRSGIIETRGKGKATFYRLASGR